MSTVVNIKFRTFAQQQLTKPSSTIYELIQALRNYYFIPEDIPNSKLIFRNFEKTIVDGDITVEDGLIMNRDKSYDLFIDVKGESQIAVEQGNESTDEKIAKMLQSVVKKLEGNKTEELMRSKLNKKLSPMIAEKLFKIGKISHNFIKEIEFFRVSLRDLTSASNQQMQMRVDQTYIKYQDHVDEQKMEDVKNIVKLITNLRNALDQKENKFKQLKKAELQKDSEIQDLMKKLKREKQNSSDTNSQVAQLKAQNDRLRNQADQLMNQVNTKISDMVKLKEDLESVKQRQQSLTEQLNQSRKAFQRKEKQLKNQILTINLKIGELNELIQQKEELLIFKDAEIKKIKQNSVEKKLISLKENLSSQSPFPALNTPKIGRLQDILIDTSLAENLIKIISTQMKKPITQFHELLSYDRRNHLQYSLKQNFQNSIHQKRSLLFVALSQEDGKFFGAFTEEEYDMQPESYFIPDFDGCSFLFTVIEKQLKHFKIQDGENSIVFDLDALIFGDDDLVIDFEGNCCSSKYVEGKSNAYNIDATFRKFLSDKLISQAPEKGKSSVNLVHYKIYEVYFREEKKRLAVK